MTTQTFTVDDMTCKSCAHHVGAALSEHFDGLGHQVDLAAKTVTVTGDAPPEAIVQVLAEAGYTAVPR